MMSWIESRWWMSIKTGWTMKLESKVELEMQCMSWMPRNWAVEISNWVFQLMETGCNVTSRLEVNRNGNETSWNVDLSHSHKLFWNADMNLHDEFE